MSQNRGVFSILVLLVLLPASVTAATVNAEPGNYQSLLGTLQPGDELLLAPGNYPRLLLDGVQGTANQWITVRSADPNQQAVITSESCCNTVQLYDCAYLTIKDIIVDVGGLDVDAINAKDSISHDILIEGCTLFGFPAAEQNVVGINTKSTAWNWTVRRNHIIEAGTGIYFGDSNGAAPFVNGVIEENLIVRPLGYCMQIKHQNDYTLQPGMPIGPNVTLVRNNVFIKDDRGSPAGDRPNLLVSGFPDAGPGSMDHYEIYGNFLYHNSRESLIQAAGRLSIHDNVFVGSGAADGQTALLITPHQGKNVQIAHVYNNTIYDVGRGIHVSTAATDSDGVVGNLVFADTAVSGSIADQRDNMSDTVANAGLYVVAPSRTLGQMDFYPLAGQASGAAIDPSLFASDLDYDRDFNGTSKTFAYRGAYSGEGQNPGWQLEEAFKGDPFGTDLDGGPGGMTPDAGSGIKDGAGGCCAVAASRQRGGGGMLFAFLGLLLFVRSTPLPATLKKLFRQ